MEQQVKKSKKIANLILSLAKKGTKERVVVYKDIIYLI